MAEELKKLDLNQGQNVVNPVAGRPMPGVNQVKALSGPKLPLVILVVVLGIASGYGLFRFMPGQKITKVAQGGQVTGSIKVGDVIGDSGANFKDTTEGVLEAETTSGEGSHSLLKPGGPSQTVNLTSSVIDLDQFVGDRVQVWGETFSSLKSGWLMDVGRVKVLELNAAKPE